MTYAVYITTITGAIDLLVSGASIEEAYDAANAALAEDDAAVSAAFLPEDYYVAEAA